MKVQESSLLNLISLSCLWFFFCQLNSVLLFSDFSVTAVTVKNDLIDQFCHNRLSVGKLNWYVPELLNFTNDLSS